MKGHLFPMKGFVAYRLTIFAGLILFSLAPASTLATSDQQHCRGLISGAADLLQLPIKDISELDFTAPAHREAILQTLDNHPNEWYRLKKYQPAFAALLEPVLFTPLNQWGPFLGMENSAIDIALTNMGGLQMENLCRVGCPWCGFSINQRAKYQQIPVRVLRSIFARLADLLTKGDRTRTYSYTHPNLQMLYYESDPFNYRMPLEENSSITYHYPEIHRMVTGYTHRSPYVSTAIPQGREKAVLDFIDRFKIGVQIRLSVSDHNEQRLSMAKPGERSFISEVNTRIEDRRARLVGILERSESSFAAMDDKALLHRLEQGAIAIEIEAKDRFLRHSPRNPAEYLLTEAQIERVKKLEGFRESLGEEMIKHGDVRSFLKMALPAIELLRMRDFEFREDGIFVYRVPVKEIGRAFATIEEPSRGIGCFDGVLVTPAKAYNLVQLPVCTPQFKDGQVVVEISKRAPVEKLPQQAPIEEVLKFGFVKTNPITDLRWQHPEERNYFDLIDHGGVSHRYSFTRTGDGYSAKLQENN